MNNRTSVMARRARAFFSSAAVLFAAIAAAGEPVNYGDYRLISDGQTVNVCNAQRSKCWQGYIATPPGRLMPPGATTHRLRFTFQSKGYFGPQNKGHFAFGVRADAVSDANGDGRTDIRGLGIVLGNVSEYAPRGRGCESPPYPGDRAVVEVYWAGGNCVHGAASTTATQLKDNAIYAITIESRDTKSGEKGRLIRYKIDQVWLGTLLPVGEGAVVDTLAPPTKGDLGGLFILEAFSTHPWEVEIGNLTETIE